MARSFVLMTLFLSATSYSFPLPGQTKPETPKAKETTKAPGLSPEALKAQLEVGAETARQKRAGWAATDSTLLTIV